jgi:hypothetical protein
MLSINFDKKMNWAIFWAITSGPPGCHATETKVSVHLISNARYRQVCQINLAEKYQNGKIFNKRPQHLPNCNKIHQMVLKIPKCP